MNFREIGPAYAPEIAISKKYWMSFPEIRLYHAREFNKNYFSTKLFALFWMSFPEIGPKFKD